MDFWKGCLQHLGWQVFAFEGPFHPWQLVACQLEVWNLWSPACVPISQLVALHGILMLASQSGTADFTHGRRLLRGLLWLGQANYFLNISLRPVDWKPSYGLWPTASAWCRRVHKLSYIDWIRIMPSCKDEANLRQRDSKCLWKKNWNNNRWVEMSLQFS